MSLGWSAKEKEKKKKLEKENLILELLLWTIVYVCNWLGIHKSLQIYIAVRWAGQK